MIVDVLVGPNEGCLNHWPVLHEVDENRWGGVGPIFGLADIRAAMNIAVAAV